MEEKLNLSVILPIKSAVVKDFDEFFDKDLVTAGIRNEDFVHNEFPPACY